MTIMKVIERRTIGNSLFFVYPEYHPELSQNFITYSTGQVLPILITFIKMCWLVWENSLTQANTSKFDQTQLSGIYLSLRA